MMNMWQFAVVAFVVGLLLRFVLTLWVVATRKHQAVSLEPLQLFLWGFMFGFAGLGLGWLWNLS